MKMNPGPLALPTICEMQKEIDTNPDYQRPPVWTKKQKQLLMDTILRNYDIPKFYWNEVNRDDGVEFEVVDGQQRLRAIWEFYKNEYPLAKDIDPINGEDVSNLLFSQLPHKIRNIFNRYSLDIITITITDTDIGKHKEEIRDMFLRLQNGTTLKAQEKRNAMSGNMRDFVKEIAEHPFFERCAFKNKSFSFDLVAAQTILIELSDGPTNVRDADLNNMYEKEFKFDKTGNISRKVKKIYNFLAKAFPERTLELERGNVINLYCIASILIDRYVLKDLAKQLADWFIAFETERRENERKDEDERDVSLSEYRLLVSQATATKESIRGRLEMFESRFFLEYPDIEKRDPDRNFSSEQRLAIYRRDKGCCQLIKKCDGEKVSWDNWHADHKIPHSKGGLTIVSNGQVACPACNLSKGGNG